MTQNEFALFMLITLLIASVQELKPEEARNWQWYLLSFVNVAWMILLTVVRFS